MSVGIQKWQESYKLCFCKLPFAGSFYGFEDDEYIELENVDEMPALLESRTTIRMHELTPLKGQRIFNPAFDS